MSPMAVWKSWIGEIKNRSWFPFGSWENLAGTAGAHVPLFLCRWVFAESWKFGSLNAISSPSTNGPKISCTRERVTTTRVYIGTDFERKYRCPDRVRDIFCLLPTNPRPINIPAQCSRHYTLKSPRLKISFLVYTPYPNISLLAAQQMAGKV